MTSAARADGVLSRIVLLTDGHANAGILDGRMLAGLCREAARNGVSTTTVGFGEGFDEQLLRRLADAGGGGAYYIERAEQAVPIFEEELEGLLSLTAQNLSIEVRPARGAHLVAVHHSYPARKSRGALHLELGNLHAREPRTLLVEFAARAGTESRDLVLGTLVIRADVMLAGGGVERREITCPIELPAGSTPCTQPEIRRELLLVATARARDEALERERRGDHAGAAGVLERVAAAIRAHGCDGDARLADEVLDLETTARRFTLREVTGEDRKYLYQRAYESARGRKEAWRRVTRE